MNDYPFDLTISEEALKTYPPEVRADVEAWLSRVRKKVHEQLHRDSLPYRNAFHLWEKRKKEELCQTK